MARIIGIASEFYRLRVTRLDQTDAPDLDWRDDILYRKPPEETQDEYAAWCIEAVSVDDDDDVVQIACFEEPGVAHEALEEIEDDLDALTRSAFEGRYFPQRD